MCDGKIVQIMECKNMRAVYLDKGGELYSTPVIAWGLTDEGDAVALVASLSSGYLEDARIIKTGEFIGLLPDDYNEFDKPLDKAGEITAAVLLPKLSQKFLEETEKETTNK